MVEVQPAILVQAAPDNRDVVLRVILPHLFECLIRGPNTQVASRESGVRQKTEDGRRRDGGAIEGVEGVEDDGRQECRRYLSLLPTCRLAGSFPTDDFEPT
jgi:hypothetical protein